MKKLFTFLFALVAASIVKADVINIDLSKATEMAYTDCSAQFNYSDGVLTVNYSTANIWNWAGVEIPIDSITGVTEINFDYKGVPSESSTILCYLRDSEKVRWYSNSKYFNLSQSEWRSVSAYLPDQPMWDATSHAFGDKPFVKIGFIVNPAEAQTGGFALQNVSVSYEKPQVNPCPIASGTCGENLTWELGCDGVMTISGTGAMENYTLQNYAPWYENRTSIQSVILSDGVTSIGEYAFVECTDLTAVTIPSSVTNIRFRAFYGCMNLSAVYISDIASWCAIQFEAEISNPLFATYSKLIKDHGADLYLDGQLVTDLVLPKRVTSIGDFAFTGCNSITSVEIPNSVTYVGVAAFYGCKNMTSLHIGENVNTIGNYAFVDCGSLTSITCKAVVPPVFTLWEGQEDSEINVFDGMDKSTCTLYVPAESVEAYRVAEEWSQFANILPIGTDPIGTDPQPCGNIASGICGENLTWIISCDSVLTISGTGEMKDYAYTTAPWHEYRNAIISVIIGEGVTSIGSEAFSYCSSLSSVTISKSVTKIGSNAFLESKKITFVNISDIAAWCAINFERAINQGENTQYANPLYHAGNLYLNNTLVENLVIPNGVTEIGFQAFAYCTSITSVTIPEGVESLGKGAFLGCSNLSSIKLPTSLTDLGTYTFYYCTALASIEIPNNVTTIGEYTFYNCTGLTSVVIPSSVTYIGYGAFDYCKSLTSFTDSATTPQSMDTPCFTMVTLANTTLYVPAESIALYKAYPNWAQFGTIKAIEDESEPQPCIIASGTCGAQGDNLTWTLTCDSVLTISGTGEMTNFAYTTAPWYEYRNTVASAIISEGVTSIGTHSLQACKKMTSVSISNSVTSIGDHAFWGCYGLTTIIIPKGVIKIGRTAFTSCPYLLSFDVAADNPVFNSVDGVIFNKNKTVLLRCPEGKPVSYSIPAGTVTIGEDAFYGCAELTSITFPESIKSIKNFAFGYCRGLTNLVLPNSLDSIGTQAFQSCIGLTSMIIPNNVIYIGLSSFAYCNDLTTIEIPASVSDIGSGAFKGCDKLVSINVETDNLNYSSENGVLFSKDKKTLVQYPAGKSETSYSIPSTVENISGSAFSGCSKLINIVFPNSVTSIGGDAFEYCKNLTSVEIPNTVRNIGVLAFYTCSNLSSVVIGSHVTTIGRSAFNTCGNLNALACKAIIPPTLGSDVFKGVEKSIPVYVPAGSIAAYQAADGWSEFTNIQAIQGTEEPCIIASGMCGENLTWKLSCDSVLTISGTGDMIDFEAFQYNATPWPEYRNTIKSVIIGEGITRIGNYAFYYCHNIISVDIPNSVTSIGMHAFRECNSLISVTIPDNVTSIGQGAFEWCEKLTSFVVTDNNQQFCSMDGVLFNKDKTTLICFPISKAVSSYVIPNSVTSIGLSAFGGCESLTSIEIPNSVISIRGAAFAWCRGLTTIVIPNSVTSIENQVFYGCSNLTSVEIPNSVTIIGSIAFSYCPVLTYFTNYAIVPQSIVAMVFENVDLSTITLYVPAESIEAYQNADVWKDFGTILAIGETPVPQPTTIELSDNDDDIENVLDSLIGDTINITINRTLSKDGSLNTICLPFSLSTSEIAASDLAGCELFEFSNAAVSGDTLDLYIAPATAIEAGKPYLIRWTSGSNITTMNFTGVTIASSTGKAVGADVRFVGTLGQTTIGGNNYLFVGANNMLYWPAVDTKLKGFRAYFKIDESVVPIGTLARIVILPEPASKIDVITYQETGLKDAAISGYQNATITNMPSGAEYIINGNCGVEFIQMRTNNNNSGLVATKSAGSVLSVEIKFNARTTDRKVYIYGSNTAFTSPTDLYADGLTPLGTIGAADANKKLTISGDYQYIGIRSAGSNVYIDEIDIEWGNFVEIPTTTLKFKSATAEVEVGKTVALEVERDGNDAITWKTSDASIATVANGVVTGIKEGTVKIIATTNNVSDECTVTVKKAPTPDELPVKSIAEFIAAQGGKCKLIGIVGTIVNDQYGNFNLTDSSGTIYVYGLLTAEGESKKFNTLGVEEGDTLTVIAETYKLYNEKPEVVNAIFVEVKKGSGVTPTPTGEKLDVNYIEAAYLEDEEGPFWEVYALKFNDDYSMDYPILIMDIDNTDSTHLAGKFNVFNAVLSLSDKDSVKFSNGEVFINCIKLASDMNSGPTYSFATTLRDETGKEYVYEFESEVYAYDGMNSTEEDIIWIDLEDNVSGDDPQPCGNIASGTCGDNLTWELSCDSVLTISGTGEMANYTSSADYQWDRYRGAIKTLVIGDNVTSISGSAFWLCRGLTSLFIPKSVTRINAFAFSECSGLTSIVVESGNPTYDSRQNCNAIIETATNKLITGCQNTTLLNSITRIGDGAFDGCQGLTTIELPNSVTSIENMAFRSCWGLTSVTIPESVTEIQYAAFVDCRSLVSVTIPKSVMYLGYEAFGSCSGLTAIEVATENPNYSSSDGVLFNKDQTMLIQYPGGKQGEYVIPSSITSIGDYAFYYCSSLTSMIIPGSITSIGDYAFYYCTGLISITNHATKPYAIDANVFFGVNLSACTLYVPAESIEAYQNADVWKDFGTIKPIEETPVPGQDTYTITFVNDDGSILDRRDWEKGSKPTCPEPTKQDGNYIYCFTGWNPSIQPVTETATYQAQYEVCGGWMSGEIYWKMQGDTLIVDGNGAIPDYHESSAPWASYAGKIKVVYIADDITRIGENAFANMSMHTVRIPESVTVSGADAFKGSSSINNVYYDGYDYQWVAINFVNGYSNPLYYGANLNEHQIQTVSVPVMPTISTSAFVGVSTVHYEGTLQQWCSTVFTSDYEPEIEREYDLVIEGKIVRNPCFAEGLTKINAYAFRGCKSIETICIPASMQQIGADAFKNTKNLQKVLYAGTLAQWCGITFANAEANPACHADLYIQDEQLGTSITIPESLTNINAFAFPNTQALDVYFQSTDPSGYALNSFGEPDLVGSKQFFVPCGTKEAYRKQLNYAESLFGEQINYSYKITSSDKTMGTVTILHTPTCAEPQLEVMATPNEGYLFTQWSDGNKDNPRTIILTSDLTLNASWERIQLPHDTVDSILSVLYVCPNETYIDPNDVNEATAAHIINPNDPASWVWTTYYDVEEATRIVTWRFHNTVKPLQELEIIPIMSLQHRLTIDKNGVVTGITESVAEIKEQMNATGDSVMKAASVTWQYSTDGVEFKAAQEGATIGESVALRYRAITDCGNDLYSDTIINVARDTLIDETCADVYIWQDADKQVPYNSYSRADHKPGVMFVDSVKDYITSEETGQAGIYKVHYLHLTFIDLEPSVEHLTSCSRYEWNGIVCNETKRYEFKTRTADGLCDSTAYLDFVYEPVRTTNVQKVCQSYEMNGKIYDEAGIYVDTITTDGCDNIVTLNLSIKRTGVYKTLVRSACESYEWDGVVYTRSGLYMQRLETVEGCDSIVTLDLTIYHPTQDTVSVTVCAGESYSWEGDVYDQPGLYTKKLISQHGCDSIVTISLQMDTIADADRHSENQTIFVGDEIKWRGSRFTPAKDTVLYDYVKNVRDCDSAEYVCNVTVLPVPTYTVNAVANNDQYGTVEGSGTYMRNERVTLHAIAGDECVFVRWSNGVRDNIYTITVTEDMEITAIFQKMQAEDTPVEVKPEAQPTETSVVVSWPTLADAVVYTIEIRKNGELICTLTFNAFGQLTGLSFYAAPSRNSGSQQARMATQTANGWQYTIGGLNPGTNYTYSVKALKSDDEVVMDEVVPFRTKDHATGLDQLNEEQSNSQDPNAKSQKFLRNGQLYIMYEGRMYDVQGKKVK